jgi:hypothetical protein
MELACELKGISRLLVTVQQPCSLYVLKKSTAVRASCRLIAVDDVRRKRRPAAPEFDGAGLAPLVPHWEQQGEWCGFVDPPKSGRR